LWQNVANNARIVAQARAALFQGIQEENGGVAQWLERPSLAGRLSLVYT